MENPGMRNRCSTNAESRRRKVEDYAVIYFGSALFKIGRLLLFASVSVHLFACIFFRVKESSAASKDDIASFYAAKGVAEDVRVNPRLLRLLSNVLTILPICRIWRISMWASFRKFSMLMREIIYAWRSQQMTMGRVCCYLIYVMGRSWSAFTLFSQPSRPLVTVNHELDLWLVGLNMLNFFCLGDISASTQAELVSSWRLYPKLQSYLLTVAYYATDLMYLSLPQCRLPVWNNYCSD